VYRGILVDCLDNTRSVHESGSFDPDLSPAAMITTNAATSEMLEYAATYRGGDAGSGNLDVSVPGKYTEPEGF